MNYPQNRNALSRLFIQQLRECIDAVRYDKNVRVVILKSDVKGTFCAGADLKERKEMSNEEVARFVCLLRSSFAEPVIAAIDGYALGGGLELALACDIRVACEFHDPRGTQRLTRAVGLSMAKELIFTGRVIGGEEANRIGLVNHCTPSDPFAKAVDIAREILPKGPVAIRVAKTAVSLSSEVSLDCGFLMEQQCYAQVIPTQDRMEALQAFAEKRKPVFKGE
ncbi:hypothetical protein KIN20_022020 [Parelaphostrongylus tenuis]|uniref:Enoyl-CoA hydratase n=1 Tax=Parelaphostrongylus tenuis TaxID=148309 RepID=A0AAD5MTH8_PARTN|nr:hypothetical protein KIN20_022020 [Parelaphostrongylus tenuis]